MNLSIARALRRVNRDRSNFALKGLGVALIASGWRVQRYYMGDYIHSPDGMIYLEFYYSPLHTAMEVHYCGQRLGTVSCGLVRHDGGNHEMVMNVEYNPRWKYTNIVYKESVK